MLVKVQNSDTGRIRYYTDQTTRFYMGKLFLCSEGCLACVIKQFGAVEAFEEWAFSSARVAEASMIDRG